MAREPSVLFLARCVSKNKMTFHQKVYQTVKKIPPKKVATYGQVASLCGSPRAARIVGWALRNSPPKVPWQKVVNHQGMISIENLQFPKESQTRLLQNEGVVVEFKHGNWWVDLNKYLWQQK